jgi:hypothetical protein
MPMCPSVRLSNPSTARTAKGCRSSPISDLAPDLRVWEGLGLTEEAFEISEPNRKSEVWMFGEFRQLQEAHG